MRKNRRLYSLIQSYQLCLLQLKFVLHCYVSAGLTSAPLGLCLWGAAKKHEGRSSAGLRSVEAPGQQCYRKFVDVKSIST